MIWSAVSLRSLLGFSEAKRRPVLPPPTKAVTFSMAGSVWTMATYCVISFSMPAKEMSWAAWMEPLMRPVSCWGKKPLGMNQ